MNPRNSQSLVPEIPEKILELARVIQHAGGRALLVGGCVRDMLMGTQRKGRYFVEGKASGTLSKISTER